MKKSIAAVFFFLAFTSVFAQYEVSVTTIDVWVKVTDKSGHPVAGLKQEDFELYEDKALVQSTCFEETTLQANPTETAPVQQDLPPIPSKKFVIFLDLYNTSQPEFLYIRPRLIDFIHRFDGTDREILLAGVRSDRKMGIFSPFTSDVKKIEELIQQAQGNALRDQAMEGNETDIQRILATGVSKGGVIEAVRSGYQAAENYARQDQEITKFSLGALAKFGAYLSKQNQTEHSIVLYVSGGFSMDPGRHYFDIMDNFTEEHREEIDEPELVVYHANPNFDFRRLLEENIGRLNRLNITLYTFNTRGLITSDPQAYKNQHLRGAKDLMAVKEFGDSLELIAQETGGTSFSNSQNFKLGFSNAIQDLDHQYLLCYNSPEHQQKDQYHKITVKLKRPDVDVRFRNGYLD